MKSEAKLAWRKEHSQVGVAPRKNDVKSEKVEKVSELEAELQLKNILLQRKSEELARAFLKHGRLEQELAFHKLDSKLDHAFSSLGTPPQLLEERHGQRPEMTVTFPRFSISNQDQPYLGLCQFRRKSAPVNQLATRPLLPVSQWASQLPRQNSLDVEHVTACAAGKSDQSGAEATKGTGIPVQACGIVEVSHSIANNRPASLSLKVNEHHGRQASVALSGRPNSAPTAGGRVPKTRLLPSYFKGSRPAQSSLTNVIGHWIASGIECQDHQESSVTSSPMTHPSSRTNATGNSGHVPPSIRGDKSTSSDCQFEKEQIPQVPSQAVCEDRDSEFQDYSDNGLVASQRRPGVGGPQRYPGHLKKAVDRLNVDMHHHTSTKPAQSRKLIRQGSFVTHSYPRLEEEITNPRFMEHSKGRSRQSSNIYPDDPSIAVVNSATHNLEHVHSVSSLPPESMQKVPGCQRSNRQPTCWTPDQYLYTRKRQTNRSSPRCLWKEHPETSIVGNLHTQNRSRSQSRVSNDVVQSGRATACSRALDTLTSITRPSPSGDDDEFQLPMDGDFAVAEPYHDFGAPRRTTGRSHRSPHTRRVLPRTGDKVGSWDAQSRNDALGNHLYSPTLSQWSADESDGVEYTIDEDASPSMHGMDTVAHRRKCAPTPNNAGASRCCRRPTSLMLHQPDGFGKADSLCNHQYHQRQISFGLGTSRSRARRHRFQLPNRGRSLDLPRTENQLSSSRLGHRRCRQQPRRELSHSPSRDEASTETNALLNLTSELMGLRKSLKQTRQANSTRLEVALKHIALLEFELQRQRCRNHDSAADHERKLERSKWEKKLAATLMELKQCKDGINELRNQVKVADQYSKENQSPSDIKRNGPFGLELEETRNALEQQREEISRLSSLLTRLLGNHTLDSIAMTNHQLQTGIAELNGCNKNEDLPVQPKQNTFVIGESLRRCQSLHAGLATVPVQYGANNVAHAEQTSTKNLFCSVPEHHYLEDWVKEMQWRVEEATQAQVEQRSKLKQTQKANRKLQGQIEVQNETIKKLTNETETYRQDLSTTRQEMKDVIDQENARRRSQEEQKSADLTAMATLKQEELHRLEQRKQEVNSLLLNQQLQISDFTEQCTKLKQERSQLENEATNLRTENSAARMEVSQLREEIFKAQFELNHLNASKQTALTSVEQLEAKIRTQQLALDRTATKEQELASKLECMEREREVTEATLAKQQARLSEGEALISRRLEDLNQLNVKAEEERAQSIALAHEIAGQKVELELLRANEKRRSFELPEEHGNMSPVQLPIMMMKDEINQLIQKITSLKTEEGNLQTKINSRNEALSEVSDVLSLRHRELDTLKELTNLEESKFTDLTDKQQDLLVQLAELQTQVQIKRDQLRHQDSNSEQITVELEALQMNLAREKATLNSLSTERMELNNDIEEASKRRENLQKQITVMKTKIEDLEKQEAQLTEATKTEELRLNQVSATLRDALDQLTSTQAQVDAARVDYAEVNRRLSECQKELQETQAKFASVKDELVTNEQVLADQHKLKADLADELARLNDSVNMGRLESQGVRTDLEAGNLALKTTLEELAQLSVDRANVDKEVKNIQAVRDFQKRSLDEQLSTGYHQLESLESAIAQKTQELNSTKEELALIKSKIDALGYTEMTYQKLKTELELKGLNKVNDPENSAQSLTETKATLVETRVALAASQRDAKRLKKRMSRELAEMERVAEEQCNRAGDLTEQLALARRQYSQLKGKITIYGLLMDEVITVASQTELTEHGKRLEATLARLRAGLEAAIPDLPEQTNHINDAKQVTTQWSSDKHSIGNSRIHQALLHELTKSFNDLYHKNSVTSSDIPKPLSADSLTKNSTGSSGHVISSCTVRPKSPQSVMPHATNKIDNAKATATSVDATTAVTPASQTTCGTTSGFGSINSGRWPLDINDYWTGCPEQTGSRRQNTSDAKSGHRQSLGRSSNSETKRRA